MEELGMALELRKEFLYQSDDEAGTERGVRERQRIKWFETGRITTFDSES
jgi:hypothetical protein